MACRSDVRARPDSFVSVPMVATLDGLYEVPPTLHARKVGRS